MIATSANQTEDATTAEVAATTTVGAIEAEEEVATVAKEEVTVVVATAVATVAKEEVDGVMTTATAIKEVEVADTELKMEDIVVDRRAVDPTAAVTLTVEATETAVIVAGQTMKNAAVAEARDDVVGAIDRAVRRHHDLQLAARIVCSEQILELVADARGLVVSRDHHRERRSGFAAHP